MHPLFWILPLLIGYLVFRAVMHRRAGRPRWCIQYLFIAGFFLCVFFYELWINR